MVDAIIWAIVIPPSLALAYFAVETLSGLKPLPSEHDAVFPSNLAVIIPAHNEAQGLAATIAALRSSLESGTDVLVVADNCTDETAAIAKREGATVIEREDPSRRGKGFALAFARDYLASSPPQAVVILDADCRVKRGTLEALASIALARSQPVQCVNLLSASADAPPLVLLSNFAMTVKNLVRARGLYRLGGGIPLFGTGMAFPWPIFSKLDLATSDAVEDVRLSLDLASGGTRVHLTEAVEVASPAARLGDSLSQRRRWEHGFLRNAGEHALPLLMTGLAPPSRHRIAFSMHMLTPPLALLLLLGVIAALAAAVGGALGGSWGPLATVASTLLAALVAICGAWLAAGRDQLSMSALVRAPLYILWKIPLYLGFFTARQTDWNRTHRPDPDA